MYFLRLSTNTQKIQFYDGKLFTKMVITSSLLTTVRGGGLYLHTIDSGLFKNTALVGSGGLNDSEPAQWNGGPSSGCSRTSAEGPFFA